MKSDDFKLAREILQRIPETAEEREYAEKALHRMDLQIRSSRNREMSASGDDLDSAEREREQFDASLELARIALRSGNVEQARDHFKTIVATHPNASVGHWGLGRCSLLGNDDLAVRCNRAYAHCQRALDLNPKCGLAHELLAMVYRTVRSTIPRPHVDFVTEDPMPSYRRAVEFGGQCDVAMLRVAEEAIEETDPELAVELLEKAARVETNQPQVYLMLAEIYRCQHRFADHDRMAEIALNLQPHWRLTDQFLRIIRQIYVH